jgi:hypothetical protein
MGKVISDVDHSAFTPTAQIRSEGSRLVGELVKVREVKTKFGPRPVYVFRVEEASCKFFRGDEEVFPEVGDQVDVFATTRLARQLSQVPIGSVVEVKYIGRGKPVNGQAPHLFHVEIP